MTRNTSHSRGAHRRILVPARIALALMLSALCVAPPALATGKPAASSPDAAHAALLADVRTRLVRAGTFSATELDAVIAELRGMRMDQLRAIADATGSPATGADRLVGPGAAAGVRDRAGALVGSGGNPATGGSGAQQSVRGQLTGGGMRDTSGHAAAGIDKPSCQACPGKKGQGDYSAMQADHNHGNEDRKDIIGKSSGDTIGVYPDGSASIKRPDGTTEYLNADHQLVDTGGNKVTPRPDDNTPGGSGRLTAADVRRIAALLGSKSEPNPDKGGGTGGGVDLVRANRTGSVGLYTEGATGTYVSRAEVKEAIRLAVETLGPVIGK